MAKGLGSGRTLDIPLNLVSLGSTLNFECACHTRSHNYDGKQLDEIVASREGCAVEDVRDALWIILRIPTDAPVSVIEQELNDCINEKAAMLARRELKLAGILP